MNCPECEAQLTARARFCHKCGWDSKLAAAGKAAGTADHRPRWKRLTMSVTLGVASLLILLLMLVPRTGAEATLVAGQQAPDFDLPALDGGRVKLADLKGKPVVVNFWASWCGPCRREMPDFQALYDKYKEMGLEIYGINVGESKIAVADFRSKVQTSFPVLIDEGDQAQNAYRILPLPATFFIDRTGTIRGIYQYQMSRAQMEVEILRILGQ
ncbi:MAG TPA: redoxin domain-containing protein [Symbiobacteriaceae bacterium]|nr:redoxin domain-containing protein [Symbiobacteriaceae bacterium]